MQIQILKELRDFRGVMRAKDLRIPLEKHFQLTEEEMNAGYSSGNGKIFFDRLSWALSYLFIAGLVEKPQKGHYKISQLGLDKLSSCSEEQINKFVRNTVQARGVGKNSKYKDGDSVPKKNDERTPEEELGDAYDRIKQNVQSQILTTILSKHPQEFEKLVVKLLHAMGYGGGVKNAGTVTCLSSDGGIDGIVKEDILGFNHIHIQAKRYALNNNVGRSEVQSFVGAVAGTSSKKGVFITTSDYTKTAMDYVKGLNGSPSIILINGRQLTEYIYNYGLGLQKEKTLEIMKMDMDYWDTMEDATEDNA